MAGSPLGFARVRARRGSRALCWLSIFFLRLRGASMSSIVRFAARGTSSRNVACLSLCILLCAGVCAPALAQSAPATRTPAQDRRTPGEARAVRAFDAAKADKANALALRAFLEKMPKGGDLHLHLSGAVYAETLVDEAVADHLCFDTTSLSLCPRQRFRPVMRRRTGSCRCGPHRPGALQQDRRRPLHARLRPHVRVQRTRPVLRDLPSFLQ